jgi:hypothetical protein
MKMSRPRTTPTALTASICQSFMQRSCYNSCTLKIRIFMRSSSYFFSLVQ